MGGSGTSGIVRFASDSGENFAVVLGVHNYARWCDIVTDIPTTQTATTLQPIYYAANSAESAAQASLISSNLPVYSPRKDIVNL
ncbi:hypothetical protein CVT25_013327 [Psilocybe cyanescens]|uniref:Uncharacterized protein n=1 Tax=Psilocybe cyanescens TaxID=93625 RepID=A0A409WST5_PSICY|nr:hypothetical protein CVT25_013327 [Psilocybe cyanescens]